MSTRNIKSIREDSIQGLGRHGKVTRMLHELQCGGMHLEIVSHVEVQSQPWKAPETLHPVPKSTQKQHLLPTQLGKSKPTPFLIDRHRPVAASPGF
ncbi:hypothetical protein TB2_022073 [Malus domestica]